MAADQGDAEPASLYTRHRDPGVHEPVLVLGMEGWVDAGLGAGTAVAHLLQTVPTEVVATFDGERLLDYRARRPTVRITDGLSERLSWPEIELRSGKDRAGHDLALLVGPEPDMAWRGFVEAVVALGSELGVRMVVALGAFPLSVPHTRPVRLAATATSRELAEQVGMVPGTIEVPAGIHAALQDGFGAAGVPAVGLWARVPNYLMTVPYPAASAALVDGLAAVAGLDLDSGDLHQAAAAAGARIDELVAASEERAEMVRQLEVAVDAAEAAAPLDPTNLPTGDELAAELERFLRGDGGTAPGGGPAGPGPHPSAGPGG